MEAQDDLLSAQGGGTSIVLQTLILSFYNMYSCHVYMCKSELLCLCELLTVCFLTRLEQRVQDKEKLERKLYSRFGMVLNEKKAKIRSLQETVRQLRSATEQQRDVKKRQRSAGWCYMTSSDALASLPCFGTGTSEIYTGFKN